MSARPASLLGLLLALCLGGCIDHGAPMAEPAPPADPPLQPEPLSLDPPFARLGSGSLLVDADLPACRGCTYTVDVTLYDASDRPVARFERVTNTRTWWPTDVAASYAVIHTAGDDFPHEATVTVDVEIVPIVQQGCDQHGYASRCPVGGLCARVEPDAQGEGIGAPVETTCLDVHGPAVFRLPDDAIAVELNAAVDRPVSLGWTSVVGAGVHAYAATSAALTDAWRTWSVVDAPPLDTLDLYVGPHRVAEGLDLREPAPLRVGAACDPLRHVDACPAGSACRMGDICRPIAAPVLSDLTAVAGDDGTVSLRFDGRDTDRDVVGLNVELVGAGADWSMSTTFDRQSRFDINLPVGQPAPANTDPVLFAQIETTAPGDLSGLWVVRNVASAPQSVRLTLVDSEGLESAVRVARVGRPAPEPVALGSMCDFAGLLFTCPDGSTCDRRDGASTAVCQTMTAGCEADIEFTELTTAGLDVEAVELEDLTSGRCSGPYAFGGDVPLIFEAPEAGRYRFDATGGAVNAIFARRQCDLPGASSSLGCAGAPGRGDGPATLDMALSAGEVVYVFVEARSRARLSTRIDVERR